MSEQKNRQQKNRQQDGQQRQGGPLQSDRGNTTVQDTVVSRIAGIAAQEVEGIHMGGGASQAAGNFLSNFTGSSNGSQTQGVSVEVGQEEAAIDLTLTTEYGKSIPQLTDSVRRNVVSRVENLVGLRVVEVNVTVASIFFPREEQHQQVEESQGQQGQQSRAQ